MNRECPISPKVVHAERGMKRKSIDGNDIAFSEQMHNKEEHQNTIKVCLEGLSVADTVDVTKSQMKSLSIDILEIQAKVIQVHCEITAVMLEKLRQHIEAQQEGKSKPTQASIQQPTTEFDN